MINAGLSLLRGAHDPRGADRQQGPGERADRGPPGRRDRAWPCPDALAKHPKIFPPLMINMTRAGEVGGFLDSVHAADRRELRGGGQAPRQGEVGHDLSGCGLRHRDSRRRRHAALHRSGLRQDVHHLGGTLPMPTRVLVILSRLLKITGAGARRRAHRRHRSRGSRMQAQGRRAQHRGPAASSSCPSSAACSRRSRSRASPVTSGRCCRSGVPILQSLDIVAETTGNMVLGNAVKDVQESVRRGESPLRAPGAAPVFPPWSSR